MPSDATRDFGKSREELLAKLRATSPRLSGAIIQPGSMIGEGTEGRVFAVKLRLGGQVTKAAQKVYDPDWNLSQSLRSQRVWYDLYAAGLPVPQFSKVDLRKSSPTYTNVFMEDMERKHGRLIKCHDGREGSVLMNWIEDVKLVDTLGRDLAAITNLGYSTNYVDFWFFYKNGTPGKYDRLVMDYGRFNKLDSKEKFAVNRDQFETQVRGSLREITRALTRGLPKGK